MLAGQSDRQASADETDTPTQSTKHKTGRHTLNPQPSTPQPSTLALVVRSWLLLLTQGSHGGRESCLHLHKGMGSPRQVAQVQEGKEILEPRTLTNSAAFKLDFPPVGVNLFPPVGSNSFPPVAANSFPPVAGNSFPPVAPNSFPPVAANSFLPVASPGESVEKQSAGKPPWH